MKKIKTFYNIVHVVCFIGIGFSTYKIFVKILNFTEKSYWAVLKSMTPYIFSIICLIILSVVIRAYQKVIIERKEK